MNFLLQTTAFMILLLHSSLIFPENIETPPLTANEPARSVSLDEAIKQVLQTPQIKVLGAKTEMLDGKKFHLIKILTADGHIHYIKIDASSGKVIDKSKK
jgi:hypothetical protein